MELQEGDRVDLLIENRTTLGYNVLINDEFDGLLYKNEVFTELEEGLEVEGYIKKIREDEKIDVSLRPQGFRNVIDADVDKILDKLSRNHGKLPINDKSSPDSIKFHFEMSKKAFKRAIGNLYKQKVIVITDKGIEMVN